MALIGVVYFAFVLVLIAMCQKSSTARQNVAGYVFAVSTLGLAGVLYLGYASFFVLKTICLLCVGSYVAIVALFILSGSQARYPMTTLFGRAMRDIGTLVRTPAALGLVVAFVAVAAAAVMVFPGEPISAASNPAETPAAAPPAAPAQAVPQDAVQQLEQYLSTQPRVPIVVGGSGAQVVIVKFNDYQCPPCGMTYREYKPILAKLQAKYPGKIAFVTRDYPLDPGVQHLGRRASSGL